MAEDDLARVALGAGLLERVHQRQQAAAARVVGLVDVQVDLHVVMARVPKQGAQRVDRLALGRAGDVATVRAEHDALVAHRLRHVRPSQRLVTP